LGVGKQLSVKLLDALAAADAKTHDQAG